MEDNLTFCSHDQCNNFAYLISGLEIVHNLKCFFFFLHQYLKKKKVLVCLFSGLRFFTSTLCYLKQLSCMIPPVSNN